MATEAVQDYLKTIWLLGEAASTTTLADRLDVAPASVSAMMRKLVDRGLVADTPFRKIELTPEGERLALDVVRSHRLIESYLHSVLGMPLEDLHEEAEVLEHAISPKLRARLAEALGNPTRDPHGDPIPPESLGRPTEVPCVPLADVRAKTTVKVERVPDRNAEVLKYLRGLGVVPGATVECVDIGPFDGPIHLRVGRRRHAIGRELAESILVSELVTTEVPT